MSKEYRFGFVITGDSESGAKALRRVREEVTALDTQTGKARAGTKTWNDETAKHTSTMEKHAASISRARSMVTGLGVALGLGFSVAGITRFVGHTIDAQDELFKMSQRVGIAVETLAGLDHAASMSGVELEGVGKGLKNVSTLLYDASNGVKSAKEDFAALGIEVFDSEGALRSSNDVLIDVADRFAAMEDGVTKNALATKIFGKAGQDLIPMLNEGSAGLADLVAEGKRLNPVTEESARQAQAYNDNMKKLGKSVTGVGVSIVNSLLPALADITGDMVEFTESARFDAMIDGMARVAVLLGSGGALYLAVAALPGVIGLGAAAFKVLGFNAAAAWMAINAGVGPLAALNMPLYGTSVAAQLAAGSLTKMRLALSLLGAAAVGWQIGDWLRDNFIEARIFGLAFVESMLNGFERLSFAGSVMWETFSTGFDKATGWITDGYAELLDVIAQGLKAIGADEMAASYASFADGVRTGSRETETLAERIARLREEMQGNIATNHEIIQALVDFEIAGSTAASTVAALAEEEQSLGVTTRELTEAEKDYVQRLEKSEDATRGVIDSLVQRARQTQMTSRQQAIDNELLKLGEFATIQSRIATIALAGALYDREKAALDAAEAEKDAAAAQLEFAKAASEAAEQASEDWADFRTSAGEAFADFVEDGDNAIDAFLKSWKRMILEITGQLALTGVLKLAGVKVPGGSGAGLEGIFANSGMAGTIAKSMFGNTFAHVAGSSSFVGPVIPGAAATAGGAAGMGAYATALASNPATWAVAALALAAKNDFWKDPDNYQRSFAGMLTAPTAGAAGSTFSVDPFASGFRPTGIAHGAEKDDALEYIDIFRELDSSAVDLFKKLKATVDMGAATLAGVGIDGRADTAGTFLGQGGKTTEADIEAMVDLYFDQLIDHVSGLDQSLLDAIRSSGSAKESIELLKKAVEDKTVADKAAEVATKEAEKAADKLAAAEERLIGKRRDIISGLNKELDSAISLYRSVQMSIYKAQGATPLFADETTAEQIGQLTEHRDLILKNHAEQMKAEEDLHKQRVLFAESFADYTRDLRLGDMSSLSSAAQLALAQNNFRTLAGAAQGGDMKALKKLQDAAEQYVSEADQSFASSGGRKTVVAEVLSVMDGLAEQLAGSEFDPVVANQALIDQLTTLNSELYGIGVGINQSIIDELKTMNVTLSELSPNMQDSLLEAIGHWVQTTSPGGQTVLASLGGIKGSVDLLPPGIAGYMSSAMGSMMQGMLAAGRSTSYIANQFTPDTMPATAANQYLGQQGLGSLSDYATTDKQIVDYVASFNGAASNLDAIRQIGLSAIENGISSERLAQALGYSQADILAAAEAAGVPKFSEGGIADGPRSGHLAILHGRERITPVNGSSGDGSAEIVSELRAQREELIEIRRVLFADAEYSSRQRERLAKGVERLAESDASGAGVGSKRYANGR